jgi:hypothetical protein
MVAEDRAELMLRVCASVVAMAMLAGCASLPRSACTGGDQRQTAELVFGRVIGVTPGPGVSEADFASFLDAEVSSRFPDGLTVIDAQGRWTPPAGPAIHEPSKVVMIVLPGHGDDRARLDAVREAYKRRFRQQSVLLMTHDDCVSF